MMNVAAIKAMIAFLSVGPPNMQDFAKLVLAVLLIVCHPPLDSNLTLRYRLFGNVENFWTGRDVFGMFSVHPVEFFEVTGETPESMLEIMHNVSPMVATETRRLHKLSPRNRLLLFLIWIRSYPSVQFLSILFKISSATLTNELNIMRRIMWVCYARNVTWPGIQEWRNMKGNWPELQDAVAAIDGTSHRIYRPVVERQQLYYSGHRHCHVIHTMVVVDNCGILRFVRSGFLGHNNDARILNFIPDIGPNSELEFPKECFILGDKIFPNKYPIMTPFRQNQIRMVPMRLRRKYARLNVVMCKYRVRVEHAIREMKIYRAVGTLWRNPRWYLSSIVDICAALAVRRRRLFN